MAESKIVNVVYYPGQTTPLTPKQLTKEAGVGIMESEFPARIEGNQCDCTDGGFFTLLPANHPDVISSGGKRYMECRVCKQRSHL